MATSAGVRVPRLFRIGALCTASCERRTALAHHGTTVGVWTDLRFTARIVRTNLAALSSLFLLLGVACSGGPPTVEPPQPRPSQRASGVAPSASTASPGPLRVRLLAFNDFHGTIKPPTGHVPGVTGEVGGASYFAAHLKRLGATKPGVLLVAAGDLVGASPLSSALFHDEPTIAVMNALGLSVTSLGNHELDEGIDELLRLKNGGCHPKDGCRFEPTFGGAKFEILGANVTSTKTHSAPLPAYVVREVSGVKIAFVGMTLEGTAHSVAPEGVAGLAFADEVKTANALVPEIRAKGVEAMVLLVHQGGEVRSPSLDECNDLRGPIVGITERLDPAYDAVISGHTHALYNCTIAGRPVTSASSFGRVVTSIDLTIDPKTRDVVRAEAHNHAVTHDIPPDAAIQAIIDRASAAAGPLENRAIGRITETLSAAARGGGDSPLGAVIADAELEATKKSGARVALVNGSGVRSDIVFAKSGDEKEDGIVTYGEAFAAQPFGNALVTLTITGLELMTVLERSVKDGSAMQVSQGLTVRYGAASGKKRVVELKLGGVPVDPKASVRVTTNSFLADRDETLKEGTNRVPGPGDLEALEAYFASHPRVSPPKAARITRD
jgi:5'-nucleotidase